ncbi:hypothetical protein J4E82_003846 [Alternaria postmessia]|uniref:uncharacterized protein n=1 Tax=Alternaria postmessia TaxID=1187938 RepID=UPI002224B5B1|nr:uncharacterized protein J4E82_003846 [Alternaria postmessia]KAI5377394.1 hypothetical protein J4E82_003846 [Alternaria postmessia]
MRLNAIILVTGLLAFANADLVARKDIDYNKGAPESHGVIGKAGDDACNRSVVNRDASRLLKTATSGSLLNVTQHLLVPRLPIQIALLWATNSLLRSTIVKSAGPLSTRANRTAAVTRLAKQHVVVPSPTRIAVTSARLPPVLPLLKQQTPMTPSHPQLTIAKSAGPPSTPVNKTAMVTRHARQGAYAPALSGKAAASASPSIVRALRVKRPLMFLRYGRP